MQYSENVMWKAVTDCAGEYDGQFFYAVKTVGVYCRPSCKSRTPLQKNVRFFTTQKEAESAGFRPCKRCRPDIPGFAPARELAEPVHAAIGLHFSNPARLTEAIKALGASANHLAHVFKCYYGLTPMEYTRQKKLERAQELLWETGLPVVEIAAEVGFESLSAFYSFFKRRTNVTPKAFRSRKEGKCP